MACWLLLDSIIPPNYFFRHLNKPIITNIVKLCKSGKCVCESLCVHTEVQGYCPNNIGCLDTQWPVQPGWPFQELSRPAIKPHLPPILYHKIPYHTIDWLNEFNLSWSVDIGFIQLSQNHSVWNSMFIFSLCLDSTEIPIVGQ